MYILFLALYKLLPLSQMSSFTRELHSSIHNISIAFEYGKKKKWTKGKLMIVFVPSWSDLSVLENSVFTHWDLPHLSCLQLVTKPFPPTLFFSLLATCMLLLLLHYVIPTFHGYFRFNWQKGTRIHSELFTSFCMCF